MGWGCLDYFVFLTFGNSKLPKGPKDANFLDGYKSQGDSPSKNTYRLASFF